MDEANIRQRVKRVLVESLALEGVEPEEIEDDTPLREELGLDSIDALELILGLEREFGVRIQDRGLGRDTFTNVATLGDFVRQRLAESAPSG